MKNYSSFWRVSLYEFIAYRTSLVFEFLGVLIKTLLVFSFWSVFTTGNQHTGFATSNQFVSYMIVASIIPSIINSDAGINLGKKIISGDISSDLIKPYNVALMLSVKSLFFSIFKFFLFLIPIMIFYLNLSVIDLKFDRFLFFVISLFLAAITMLLLYLSIGILSFWTENWWGMKILFDGIIAFFSGSLMPINIFPEWLQTINRFLPFQYTVFLPAKILVTDDNIYNNFTAILSQLLWICLISLIFYLIWNFAIKRLVIFGG